MDTIKKLKTSDFSTDEEFESFMADWNNVKQYVICRLLGKGLLSNLDYMEGIVTKDVLDLKVSFVVSVKDDAIGGNYLVSILESQLESWGFSVDELWEVAWKNTHRLYPCEIQGTADILLASDKYREECSEEELAMLIMESMRNDKMWRISFPGGSNGAIYMLEKSVLAALASTVGSDVLIVLPSSMHEVLALGAASEYDLSIMNDNIICVNDMLECEELLSDHYYLYDVRRDEIYYHLGDGTEVVW